MPWMGRAERRAVADALAGRRLSMGAEVTAFERETAECVGRDFAVAVSSGTVALDIALILLDLHPEDEVITSALSYVAAPNAIIRSGATPVFCDVEEGTLNIDPEAVAKAIGPRTRAVLVSDYCGSPASYGALTALCEHHGLALLVDGAQSLLSAHGGRPVCSLGVVSTTSFHAAKPVVCGEGGMIFTDDEELAERARRLRNQGEVRGRKYVHDTLGQNARLTDVAAAIGRAQLERVAAIRERRRELAERYAAALAEVPGVGGVRESEEGGVDVVWFSWPLLVPRRDAVAGRLACAGVETRSLYPVPAYRQPMPEYQPFEDRWCPTTERASGAVLNLPLFAEMTGEEVDIVVSALRQAIGASASLGELLD